MLRQPSPIEFLKSPQKQQATNPSKAAAELFKDDNAYGTSLFLAASKVLTLEELGSFAPRTIRLELKDALRLSHIPQDNMDRLMAAIAIVTTDRFYTDVPAFIDICNILSGTPPAPNVFDPADAYEVAWALAEATILDGFDGEQDEDQFSEEIRLYIGMMLEEDGFFSAPSIMKMAIMTNQYNPATSFADSSDIMPAVMEADEARHSDIQMMVVENMASLVAQLDKIQPGIVEILQSV